MHLPLLLLLLLSLVACVDSYKFLVYSTRFAKSHATYLGGLADVLVDAGHEVVMLSPIMNRKIGGVMTKKARVIEVPQCDAAVDFEEMWNGMMSEHVWERQNLLVFYLKTDRRIQDAYISWGHVCNSVIEHPGLIEQLKNENFDAAFTETFDYFVFHLLGIDKWAITESVALKDDSFYYTQTPSNPAYIPTMMSGSSDAMSFWGRLSNTVSFAVMDFAMNQLDSKIASTIRNRHPNLPPLKELTARNSLVFYNSEPLLDFPKITSARVIDIGGISVSSTGHKQLNETWSDILALRPSTVLISFGTVAQAFSMPDQYKRTIRETARRFPDVTFIWKYEKPEHNISAGIPNLIESTWIPQRDILHDPRLKSFITHCGQGSTSEAIEAGVPLIVIPVMGDQQRNSYQVEKNGIGLRLDKTDLASVGKLDDAIRTILENDSYRANVRKLRTIIADRPFAMKEIFVHNMEFLAKHGPLRQLDHYGRNLNFFQYYLIDVIAFVSFVIFSIFITFALFVRGILRRVVFRKSKQE